MSFYSSLLVVELQTSILGVVGLEPTRLIKSTDFKSVVSTIPPYPHYLLIKATPRFELGIEDLQSTALPLGHIAYKNNINTVVTLYC